jgi:hypothetical protein
VCIRCHVNVFTEPLPSNDREDTHAVGRDFMKHAVEMGSGALIYIPSFINIGSVIQKLIMGGGGNSRDTVTQTAWRSHKPTFIFFQNKENRLKTVKICLYLIKLMMYRLKE